jgi:hypothetical protein
MEKSDFPTTGFNPGNEAFYQSMTLRDYFAGQALSGITAKVYGSKDYNGPFKCEDIADEAYLLADAMLSRRVKEPYYGK